jgi:hypothetical protein
MIFGRSPARGAWLAVAVTCASLLLVTGCFFRGARRSQVEEQMGDAHRSVMARQIENPERSENRTPVDGLGATTAADVLRNYHENQTTEAQERRQDRQRDNGLSDIDN